jgi:hypothetical protein
MAERIVTANFTAGPRDPVLDAWRPPFKIPENAPLVEVSVNREIRDGETISVSFDLPPQT